MTDQASVLSEVAAERARQDARWGEQNHPNGTGPDLWLYALPVRGPAGNANAADLERWARDRCKRAPDEGGDTYERILTEEWAEAIAEADPARLRAELVQVAAVAVAWVEKIDRDAAAVANLPRAEVLPDAR